MSKRKPLVKAMIAAVLVLATAAQASAALRIDTIHYDPPGPDNRSPASLRAERITLINMGANPINLGNYFLMDGAGVTYEFPTGFMLHPGKRVALHTGSGTTKAHHLYWGKANYVWNNGGDVARLRRESNFALVDGCMYTGVPNGVARCN